jgi:hypothetical protein
VFNCNYLSTMTCNSTKSKGRGRPPLNRGKMLSAGKKGKVPIFWDSPNAFEHALDDSMFPDAQPKGNYAKTKHFLKTAWCNKEEFTLPELKEALGEKYPEQADYNGFRLQRWHEAYYWEGTGKVAVKPLYKKATYRTYHNIFYVEPNE